MYKFSSFLTKKYKVTLIIWLIISIISVYFAIGLPSALKGDGFKMDAEHEAVTELAASEFDFPYETLFLVFDNIPNSEIESQLEKIEKLKITSEIISPLDKTDLKKDNLAYSLLHFDQNDNMPDYVDKIRATISSEHITLTGQEAIAKDINQASQKDLIIAESIGLPIAIIVLIFAFGTLTAAILPLIIGLSTVLVTFSMLTFIGKSTDLSIFVLNIVPMLGLALSIDFALLLISRYREERVTHSNQKSIIIMMQTAGRSVLFSSLSVMIGLAALLLIKVQIFENIALGGMLVVAFAVISSLTLLPALLLLIGDRIDQFKVFTSKHKTSHWRNFAESVIKHPVKITIGATLILLLALIPIKDMELTIPQLDALPLSYESRGAFEKIQTKFNLKDESTVFLVSEREGGWNNTSGLKEIDALTEYFKADSDVKELESIFTVSDIKNANEWEKFQQNSGSKDILDPLLDTFIKDELLIVPVTLNLKGSSTQAQDWVRNINKSELDTHFLVGGEAKFNQEIFDEISDKILHVISVIIFTTFILLMIAFRSILIPIKAIVMNVLGLGATFGVLVYLFQYGHLGIEPGTIVLIIPVIVFSLVFGLSMDYEVFLISRMQEEYALTQDNDHATVEGLALTSKIISSAALIMIVLTGAFAFTDVLPVKQIGVGIAIAIFIDATIIRLLLVPSLMKLLGKWNWWLPFRKGPYKIGKAKVD